MSLYNTAMDDREARWLFKALREAAGVIEEHFSGLDREALTQRPSEGELALIEIAALLRDNEEQVSDWLELILTSSHREPLLPYVNIDLLPFERDYCRLDIHQVLRDFALWRRRTLYFLWDLEPQDWERRGIHPYRGLLSIYQIVRELNWHDLHYLWQIRRLRARFGRVHIDV